MPEDNSRNLLFFEGASMRELFDTMNAWQSEHGKRLLSTHIEKDGGKFCCIALTNPMAVTIVDRSGSNSASVSSGRRLYVWT